MTGSKLCYEARKRFPPVGAVSATGVRNIFHRGIGDTAINDRRYWSNP